VDATFIAPNGQTLGTEVDWKTAQDTEKNPTFVSRLGNSNGGAFLPGTYTVNFFLNRKFIAQKKVEVVGAT
jgi:outer membrane usher protein FimD/PapC